MSIPLTSQYFIIPSISNPYNYLSLLLPSGFQTAIAVFLGYCGYIVWGILFLIMIYYALRVEKFKKENDIMTYKEIVAFTEGKQLDEIEKAQEKGKRPYQQLLSALLSATIGFIISMFFVWLLKSYIF